MINAFFLAMLLYPEVQKTGQAEIDTVIGPTRLPSFTDRATLPYVNAIVTEVLRWHTVGPLGSIRCSHTTSRLTLYTDFSLKAYLTP